MKFKLVSILIGLLLTASIAGTLTGCGKAETDTSSVNEISNGTSSTIASIPENTAISDLDITIPEGFVMDVNTATSEYTLFTLKTTNGSETSENNADKGNQSTTAPDNNNASNNAGNTTSSGNHSSTPASSSAGENSSIVDEGDVMDKVTIRVINVKSSDQVFQEDINSPATPESATNYLTHTMGYSNVSVDNFLRTETEEQIRYEYRVSYTTNGTEQTQFEFTCLTNKKFVAITVTPKSEAYIQAAQIAFRQVIDTFQP